MQVQCRTLMKMQYRCWVVSVVVVVMILMARMVDQFGIVIQWSRYSLVVLLLVVGVVVYGLDQLMELWVKMGMVFEVVVVRLEGLMRMVPWCLRHAVVCIGLCRPSYGEPLVPPRLWLVRRFPR